MVHDAFSRSLRVKDFWSTFARVKVAGEKFDQKIVILSWSALLGSLLFECVFGMRNSLFKLLSLGVYFFLRSEGALLRVKPVFEACKM